MSVLNFRVTAVLSGVSYWGWNWRDSGWCLCTLDFLIFVPPSHFHQKSKAQRCGGLERSQSADFRPKRSPHVTARKTRSHYNPSSFPNASCLIIQIICVDTELLTELPKTERFKFEGTWKGEVDPPEQRCIQNCIYWNFLSESLWVFFF